MLGWGVARVDSHYVFTYLHHQGRSLERVRLQRPRVEELTQAMSVEMDQASATP